MGYNGHQKQKTQTNPYLQPGEPDELATNFFPVKEDAGKWMNAYASAVKQRDRYKRSLEELAQLARMVLSINKGDGPLNDREIMLNGLLQKLEAAANPPKDTTAQRATELK